MIKETDNLINCQYNSPGIAVDKCKGREYVDNDNHFQHIHKAGINMEKYNRWQKKLQAHGYRLTIPREVIINTLSKSNEHLSAEDIYMIIHTQFPSIGLTTIYRTLEILTRIDMTVKFDFGDGRTRYELSEDSGNKKHHHHLICTQCAKIIDYSDFVDEELELIQKTEKELSQKYNFNIKKHLIRFYGLCDNCQH